MTKCDAVLALEKDIVFLSLKWWHKEMCVVSGDEVNYFCANDDFLVH